MSDRRQGAATPVPLDEYPLHQVPLSLGLMGTTDRNAYDRCYLNAHDRTGDLFLISGFGVYPNLGVKDAYALLRRGDEQHAVRFSDALDDDRMSQRVGGYLIEVLEPLQRLRVVCDGDEHGLGFDLTWEGSFPPVQEAPHIMRIGARAILDAARFAQVGTWRGVIRVGHEEIAVEPDRWVGTRDRSWGIRPVGEGEPAGRGREDPTEGLWWLYVPLRFDDFAVVIIVQERPDGYRTLNDAVRVWPDGRLEQLGWPRVEIAYRSGTRLPTGATIHVTGQDGAPGVIEVESLGSVPLHIGAGYGGDPDWSHGQWKGTDWSEGVRYDMTDPAVVDRAPWGVIDHVARATFDGREGWGLFEHGTMGRHDPSGFADFMDVAP